MNDILLIVCRRERIVRRAFFRSWRSAATSPFIMSIESWTILIDVDTESMRVWSKEMVWRWLVIWPVIWLSWSSWSRVRRELSSIFRFVSLISRLVCCLSFLSDVDDATGLSLRFFGVAAEAKITDVMMARMAIDTIFFITLIGLTWNERMEIGGYCAMFSKIDLAFSSVMIL